MLFELLVPAADVSELHRSIGEEVTFHTILYLEGDATRGNLEPRLIGFVRPEDREFFEHFTTVKGIGVRTALKALHVPVAQIAHAIESRDARFLTSLKGIGKRTAELIVAELAGKVTEFAVGLDIRHGFAPSRRVAFEEDAIEGLMALGEPRVLAERLIERARQINPDLKTSDALLREMLRLRTARA
jgi:Holliday junction DNA helicase RuvA